MHKKKNNKLYLFVAERNIIDGKITYGNVGESINPEKRKKNPDYNRKKAAGNWITINTWDIDNFSDRNIHSILIKKTNGDGNQFVKDPDASGNTEEFLFNMDISEAIKLLSVCVNECLHGNSSSKSFKMREEQKECVDKAYKYFLSGGKDFLLDCKMRFGKNHVSYQICKNINAKNILLLSFKTAIKDGWKEDLDHIDFCNYRFNNVESGYEGEGIYFSSMQGIMADRNALNKKREWIFNDVEWDIVIFDEEHYGKDSFNSQKILSNLVRNSKTKKLYLSGTPYKSKLSGSFSKENTYSWSYLDENKRKKSWSSSSKSPYELLPDMEFHTVDICKYLKEKNLVDYKDDEQFNINKMFAVDKKGSFVHNDLVDVWLDITASGRISEKGKLSPFTFIKDNDSNIIFNHLLWIVNKVNVADALKKKIEKHVFWKNFKVINAAGNNVTSVEETKKHINTNNKTITIVVSRFLEGVTIPEWCSVWFLSDIASPMRYYQAAFRCQSIWTHSYNHEEWFKKKCYIIDFNPTRLLKMIWSQEYINNNCSNKKCISSINEWLDCAPIFQHGNISSKKISISQILNIKIEDNFISNFNKTSVFDESLKQLSQKIKERFYDISYEDFVFKRELIKSITGEVEKGKVSESTSISLLSEIIEKENSDFSYESLKEKIRVFLKKIPSYLFVSNNNITDVSDIFSCMEEELFFAETFISLKDFYVLCEIDAIDIEYLNNCILDFNLKLQKIEKLV